MDDSEQMTLEAGKVVSVAPERNETEEAVEPEWNFDAEIIVIWVTGGVVLVTLLGMLICLLATRKKSRSSTATIRARPHIDEEVTSVYRPRGGENPAYSVTNDEDNEWFSTRRPRVLNSLSRPSDCVYLPDACNQGRQHWNSPESARSSTPEIDQQQMTIPPLDVPETGQTYQSGPPPPSPPPPLSQQSRQMDQLNSSTSDDNRPTYIIENNEFVLDPYFLASAPPPYTPYAEDHPVNITSIERSLTLPVRNGTSYRVDYDYF